MNYNGEIIYVCAVGYNNAGSYKSMVNCRKTLVSYSDEAVYKKVVYYRYRDVISGQTDTKWADCL